MARYAIVDAATDEALTKHRTRQGAVDAWREQHAGRRVRIVRTTSDRERRVIAEGVWYEATTYPTD
jgi:hypothetical protein